MLRVQTWALPVQAPLQPLNTQSGYPGAVPDTAVRVTTVPVEYSTSLPTPTALVSQPMWQATRKGEELRPTTPCAPVERISSWVPAKDAAMLVGALMRGAHGP